MDVGSADRLAQRDLHITEQNSNRVIPPYLFDPSIPDQARRTFSGPDALLVTPYPANPNRPPTPSLHRVLRSMRPTRPGAQSEASQQQHTQLCQQPQVLGIDSRKSTKLAQKLHAHSVQCAHKLTSTRRAIENTHHNSGALGPHAVTNSPDPHWLPSSPLSNCTGSETPYNHLCKADVFVSRAARPNHQDLKNKLGHGKLHAQASLMPPGRVKMKLRATCLVLSIVLTNAISNGKRFI
eukprot:1141336-Pelagomonas_calceolata.AAC.7